MNEDIPDDCGKIEMIPINQSVKAKKILTYKNPSPVEKNNQ